MFYYPISTSTSSSASTSSSVSTSSIVSTPTTTRYEYYFKTLFPDCYIYPFFSRLFKKSCVFRLIYAAFFSGYSPQSLSRRHLSLKQKQRYQRGFSHRTLFRQPPKPFFHCLLGELTTYFHSYT